MRPVILVRLSFDLHRAPLTSAPVNTVSGVQLLTNLCNISSKILIDYRKRAVGQPLERLSRRPPGLLIPLRYKNRP